MKKFLNGRLAYMLQNGCQMKKKCFLIIGSDFSIVHSTLNNLK